MNLNKSVIFTLGLITLCSAGDIVPRDSNFNNTGGYDSSKVEARLIVNVDEKTNVVHFVRDNNDPRVVTKTYKLQNVDAYELRDYIRQMVQAKRVGNTSLQQTYPSNSGTSPATVSTVSEASLTTPVSAQPSYSPTTQLGSNTAVECLKYADGTGLLMVSAEEYRFKDHKNGMGIDTLVGMLDQPGLGALDYGTQIFIYMPKYVPARNLKPLIENMGMNISDVTELWQGSDLVTYDPDLNWLIFDVSNYSCANIAKMLKLYDVPIPQVRLKIKIYEVYSENDDKMGIDFQSWKNNEGADFFSVGGRYRNNWAAAYGAGGMDKSYGSERTSFYNFNPKWNSRYLDFLASKGRAQISNVGELVIRNNTSAKLERTTQIFYMDDSQAVSNAITLPDKGVGAYELLSSIVGVIIDSTEDIPVAKGNQQITTKSSGYGFTMTVSNASVNLLETRFKVTLSNTSLIGFQSNGTPRTSSGNTVSQDVSLPHGTNRFVIGALRKQEQVKSKTGVPFLMDIPWLGYIFCSESTSLKDSELIVVAECQWDAPPERLGVGVTARDKKAKSKSPYGGVQ